MAGLKLQTKSADKILYGIKFPWDDKATLIQMLGLQAASSTTNTRASSAVNLKQGVLHTSGSRSKHLSLIHIGQSVTRFMMELSERLYKMWRLAFGVWISTKQL
ncbi:hypothetical protein [Companilactobacillus paralimentarius]|uniref:hypothetical protein n=1 Tax=Companilactobacillus paralimentarius TaxID=83526 RepID=UPI00384BEEDB